MENNLKRDFIKKFRNIEKYGFYDFIEFEGDVIGFSVKKKLKNETNKRTLISVGIIKENEESKRPLYIRASYGEQSNDGIEIRSGEEIKINDPIDLESRNEYFYDITEKKLYKKNKEINPDKFVNEIFKLHIKTTEPLKGFLLRTKIKFWRRFLKTIFKAISEIFHYLLFIISGNSYRYESFLEKEILNNEIIRSKWPEIIGEKYNLRTTKEELVSKEKEKKSETINFFNYEASYWSIIFYSILHLGLYVFFVYKNYNPSFLDRFLESNFLIIIYIIPSLWFLESIIPKSLIFLIKHSSRFSDYCLYKTLKV